MLTGPYAEEYDGSLQAEYAPRDPVREFILGEITCRQLRVLAQCLPETSALVRATRGNAWTDLHYLVATVGNDLKWLRSEQIAIAAEKTPRKPDLIKPPPEAPTIESEDEQAQQDRRQAEFTSVVVTALFPNE